MSGYLDIDVGGALMEKLVFTPRKADHKTENGATEGDKRFRCR